MPNHIETATAPTEASTPHAPLTPQSHAVARSEAAPTSRIPIGNASPSRIESGASSASTTAVRPARLHAAVASTTG